MHPACNAHAPYCHLRTIRLYKIFPHYLINGTIFGGGGELLKIECVFSYYGTQFLSQQFLILRRIERDMVYSVYCSVCSKITVILIRFRSNLNISPAFSKNTQISALMKMRPVGAEMFRAGRTANSRFSPISQLRSKMLPEIYNVTAQKEHARETQRPQSVVSLSLLTTPERAINSSR